MNEKQQIIVNGMRDAIRWPRNPDWTLKYQPDERFIVVYDDGETVHAANTERASWLLDMVDTLECGFQLFYVKFTANGALVVPVVIEKPVRHNENDASFVGVHNDDGGTHHLTIFASARMLVDGEEVGIVRYTDH